MSARSSLTIRSQHVEIRRYHTIIVGAGAAGMNCAVHLYEFLRQRGVEHPERKIAVLTADVHQGASRRSGSDKQTYYKLGNDPFVVDGAADFARCLTDGGCVHEDTALVEGLASLREFYHLVQLGVPFPHDALGGYIGYKTDHDPRCRATSAGPKTSLFMSECLQRQVERYGVPIFDGREVVRLATTGEGDSRRIRAVVTLDRRRGSTVDYALEAFVCDNLVLATGGPGDLYQTTVYPAGQCSLHGLALEAGLAAENLTESQFGLASVGFRWNVSGTYMQAIPYLFSTAADGSDERNFLADLFPTMRQLATGIFLKGYQWPFDAGRVARLQSSLIDLAASDEIRRGRRVFMDFRRNPQGRDGMNPFDLNDLEPEAAEYLQRAGATQALPLDRLAHMNPPAIELFAEHGIDLRGEPLEIAVCAQHNNGGLAVNAWWESNLARTFVIGELAGTHGVKRPGGAALNAGQVGGLRAAEYIANVYPPDENAGDAGPEFLQDCVHDACVELEAMFAGGPGLDEREVLQRIRRGMSNAAGHLRRREDVQAALADAATLHRRIAREGFSVDSVERACEAIRAKHQALTAVAYLKAVLVYLERGGGSRGSYLVLTDDGEEIHPRLLDERTGRPLRFRPENVALRREILRLGYDPASADLFDCRATPPRTVAPREVAFETAWSEFRSGGIFR